MKPTFLVTLAASAVLAACVHQSAPQAGPDAAPVTAVTIDDQAAQILARMTLEEKIGQVIQADISAVTPDEARAYNLGSVLNGGNSAPGGGKVAPVAAWIDLADAFWMASTDTSDGGVGIPLLWGTDAVHGHNNLQSATIFPHNSALGATHNPGLLHEIASVTAREIRATGLDWTFAPTLAVARDDRWGRAYESYSENPELVAAYADAFVRGLQGDPDSDTFLKANKVVATAKHFIGDGGTQYGIDRGDTIGAWDDILRVHGAGYGPAISAGVQVVMASFSSVNGEKVHGSKWLLNDVLRGQLGFDGFVVGDWDGHGEVPGCTPEDCLPALEAGLDMYMAPESWKELYGSLLAHARSGRLDLARLDEAVLRILRVKLRTGLFEAGLPSQRATTGEAALGSDAHRAIARRAVRESLVLLKNEAGLLPLAPTQTILVTGSGADSMQQQTGGWTLNWQGTGNSNDDFLTGETIFSGLSSAVADAGGTVVLSPDGSFDTAPDVAIVVFGEAPYAEYRGDRTDLVYEFDDGENLQLIRGFKASGIPVVSVFLTGRPLWVNPHLNASDAFVVAWLPGTEGGGVGDVLIGDEAGRPVHEVKGRLSFSWPADGAGAPINDRGDAGVLYPFGYGLDYSITSPWQALPEDPGVSRTAFSGQVFQRGEAVAPFNLFLGDSSNANTRVDALVGQSISGAVTTRGVDYTAQEDARLFSWTGETAGTVKLQSGRVVDLADEAAADGLSLVLDWQVVSPPSGEFELALGCGEGCEGAIDISEDLNRLPTGTWVRSQVPLSCFVNRGLDLAEVQTALSLKTATPASIALHAAAIRAADTPASGCGIDAASPMDAGAE